MLNLAENLQTKVGNILKDMHILLVISVSFIKMSLTESSGHKRHNNAVSNHICIAPLPSEDKLAIARSWEKLSFLSTNPSEMTWPHSGSSRKYNVYIWPMIWDIMYLISKTSDQIRALERRKKTRSTHRHGVSGGVPQDIDQQTN